MNAKLPSYLPFSLVHCVQNICARDSKNSQLKYSHPIVVTCIFKTFPVPAYAQASTNIEVILPKGSGNALTASTITSLLSCVPIKIILKSRNWLEKKTVKPR